MKKFQSSLQLDISHINQFGGKPFKMIADMIRSGIKNEHGFRATKNITDSRLGSWPIVIRFVDQKNRNRFENSLREIIRPQILRQMNIKHLNPNDDVIRPVRWANR